MKQSKASLVAGITCTVILSCILLASSVFKFTMDPMSSKGQEFAEVVGIGLIKPLALTELGILILIWIPRTATIGYILSFGYFSGATATHLTHGSAVNIQPALMILTLIAAFFRTPELFARLFGSKQIET
jgi:hypothetical protein